MGERQTEVSASAAVVQDVAEEQLGSAGDAQQHLTATHQAVVGLSNLGNTCFFNSSVQLLLSCAPLQQMLSQNEHDISRGPLGFALQQATLHAAGKSSEGMCSCAHLLVNAAAHIGSLGLCAVGPLQRR